MQNCQKIMIISKKGVGGVGGVLCCENLSYFNKKFFGFLRLFRVCGGFGVTEVLGVFCALFLVRNLYNLQFGEVLEVFRWYSYFFILNKIFLNKFIYIYNHTTQTPPKPPR